MNPADACRVLVTRNAKRPGSATRDAWEITHVGCGISPARCVEVPARRGPPSTAATFTPQIDARRCLGCWHPNCCCTSTPRCAVRLPFTREEFFDLLVLASRSGVVGGVCAGVRMAGLNAAFARPLDQWAPGRVLGMVRHRVSRDVLHAYQSGSLAVRGYLSGSGLALRLVRSDPGRL